MEFDSLFTAVQGILRSHQNTTVVPFVRVNKDNDIVSKNIVDSMANLISELSLKEEHKRKINLLLIVNTDFPSIATLEDDKNFWHLLGCLPKLSSYLYFRIATELDFHVYVGESIRLCPEYLSIEVLQAINDHLKYINPPVAISFLQSLYEGIFQKIVELQKNGKEASIIQKFVKIFKDVTSLNIKELIVALPWELEKKYIYFGYLTQMFLLLLRSCIVKMKIECDGNDSEIYDFNVDYDYSKWDECQREINWTNHCLSILVGKCADAVMAISVDIYMSWCEEDIKGSVDKTLQTAVREAAYTCREEIRSICHLNDDISSLKVLETSLNNIALQPTTEDDEIRKADAETIVINLLNPKRTQVKWLKGLICIPGIFQSTTYMKVIQDSAHLFDLEVAKVLLDSLLDFLSMSQCPRDFFEEAKIFFFSCIKKQPLSLQLELLTYYVDSRNYSNLIERENFQEALTASLNKLSAISENKDEMISEIVMLCFENCEILVSTLLKECLSSNMKADLLLDLLTHIKPLANMPCSNSSLSLTCNTTIHLMDTVITSLDKKKDSFVQLVRKLCALDLLNGNIFFPTHVLPRFEESLNENNIQGIVFFLDLLSIYVDQSSLPVNSTALLAFFTKCLDNLRPGISNFSIERMLATSKTIEIVRKITNKIINTKDKEDDEIAWLRNMSMNLKPISRIHVGGLWRKWGQDVPSLPDWVKEGLGLGDQLLSPSPIERRDIVTATVKVLPTLTLSEWYLLGSLDTVKSDLIFPTVEAIVDSILVAIQVPFLLKNLQIIHNMLINFFQYIWEKVIPKVKTMGKGKDNKRLRDRLAHLQEVLPEELQKSRAPQMQLILQAINEPSNEIIY